MVETGQPSRKLTHLLVPNATQSGGGGFTGTAYMQMVPLLEEPLGDRVDPGMRRRLAVGDGLGFDAWQVGPSCPVHVYLR